MSTETDFLTTCAFLTDAQRQALRDQDLDTPSAFKHITVARLEAEPFRLSAGRASKLLDAAGVGGHPPSPPSRLTIEHAEPATTEERIDRALLAAHENPTAVARLVELHVQFVVLQTDDKIDVRATKAMLAHAAAGGPLGSTWAGQRVVATHQLSTPPIWCSPPTGRPLQAGVDDRTGIPWGSLGIDGLRIAFFGYQQGVFGGESDKAVFTEIQDPKGRQRVLELMKATNVKPEDMDGVVVYHPRSPPSAANLPTRPRQPANPPRVVLGSNPVSSLTNLFVLLFDAGELRRFLRNGPDGTYVSNQLPEGGSAENLAFEAASVLHRRGNINRALRDRLILERPAMSLDIDAVFSAAGLV